jgi:hypothetical protein
MSDIYKDIDLTPMYLFCKASDGKLSCLFVDKTLHDKDISEKDESNLINALGSLADSFHAYMESSEQSAISGMTNRINVLQNELNIYENCLYVLAHTKSETLRNILNSSEYGINLPEWGSNNYVKELEIANNKLGKLRNLIKRTVQEYQYFLKVNGIEAESEKSNTDAFIESLQNINRWQGFKSSMTEITMKEYAVALKLLKTEVKKHGKNG